MSKMSGKILLLVLLLASFSGCTSEPPAVSLKEIAEVTRGDLVVSAPAEGNLSLPRQLDLSFSIAGRVVEIKVKEGDKVMKEQQLARLDDTDYQQAVKVAEVDLKAARNKLQAAEIALETARHQLQMAGVDLETARHQLQMAQSDVEIAEYTVRQSEITYTVSWEDGGIVVHTQDLTDIAYTDLPGVRLALEQADAYLNKAKELLAKGDFDAAQAQLDLVQQKLVMGEEKSQGKRARIPLEVSVNVLQL